MDLLRKQTPGLKSLSKVHFTDEFQKRSADNQPKMLSFPNTRSVLWDQRPKGQSTLIHLTEYRNPLLVLEEKTLWLMQRFAAQDTNSDDYRCLLLGSVASDPDGEGIQISIDRLDPNVGSGGDESMPGELSVHCLLKKNAARSDFVTVDDYSNDIKALHHRVISKDKVDLGRFLALRAYCSYHVNQENHIFHIDVDLSTLAIAFRATPVASVPVVPTALSKNLSGPMSLSELQGEPKTGYLTMDHTRKLVLVLESDPKVASLPLVGIWLSGIHNVHDPFVWASCLRYLYNDSLQDRVCRPPEAFLVVLYSPLHSQPEFYNLVTSDSKSNLHYSLHTCHEVVSLPKDSPVRPRSPLEVELLKAEHGNRVEVFQAALQENSDLMASPPAQKTTKPGLASPSSAALSGSMEDIVPRSMPAPHLSRTGVSMVRHAVPEVSLLLDENDHMKPHPLPHPHPSGLTAAVTQPPYPAAFKEKKSKKKTHTPDGPARGPLKTVNGVPPYASLQAGYNSAAQSQWPSTSVPSHGYNSRTPPQNAPLPGAQWTPQAQQWSNGQLQPPPGPPQQQQPPGTLPQQYPGMATNTPPQGYNPALRGPMAQPQMNPIQPQAYQQTPPQQPPMTSYAQPFSNAPLHQSMPVYSSQGHVLPPQPPPHVVTAHSQSLPYHQATPPQGPFRPPMGAPMYRHYAPTPPQPSPSTQASPAPFPSPIVQQSPLRTPVASPHVQPAQPTPQQQPLNVVNEQIPLQQPTPPVPQPTAGGDAASSSCQNTPVKSQSGSSQSSPVSKIDGSQVPPEVLELLKQQDSQLKELRGQLEQLLLKQTETDQQQADSANRRELTSTATQSSAHSSPVKKVKTVAEMAVNTSLWWPQAQEQQDSQRNHTIETHHVSAQVLNNSRIKGESAVNDRLNPHDDSQCGKSTTKQQPSPHHNTSHNVSRNSHHPTLNHSRRSHHNQSVNTLTQHKSPSQRHEAGGSSSQHRTTPPRPPQSNHTSPCSQDTMNQTCSLSELQLNNLHDRTEESYISMVVDMPESLSPEKSPNGGSSGYGDTDDSNNRSPVLGESVSMYEQNLHDESHGGPPLTARTINQSVDTGLGDSHPQVSLLYRNQHEFYNNLLGNLNKFLTKHTEEEGTENENEPPHREPEPQVVPQPTRVPLQQAPKIATRPEVDKSIDVAAQTREQLRRLGINMDDLETNEQPAIRSDQTVMFDPRLLPKINYVSMMLDSDSDLSADADSLAMKYLSDDQLAELAKVRLSGMKGKQRHKHDTAIERVILSNTTTEETTFSAGSNHLSFASKKYMERYGLLEDRSCREAHNNSDNGRHPDSYSSKPRYLNHSDSHKSEKSETSTIDPAILNAKAVLERLKEASFLNATNISTTSSHNNNNDSHCSRTSSGSGGHHHRLGRQHSVTSDTTVYHSPNHTPHQYRSSGESDRSMDSTHSAPGRSTGHHGGIRVFNDSVNSGQNRFKTDRNQFNFSSRSQPPSEKPQGDQRILDIERLKELPKLL